MKVVTVRTGDACNQDLVLRTRPWYSQGSETDFCPYGDRVGVAKVLTVAEDAAATAGSKDGVPVMKKYAIAACRHSVTHKYAELNKEEMVVTVAKVRHGKWEEAVGQQTGRAKGQDVAWVKNKYNAQSAVTIKIGAMMPMHPDLATALAQQEAAVDLALEGTGWKVIKGKARKSAVRRRSAAGQAQEGTGAWGRSRRQMKVFDAVVISIGCEGDTEKSAVPRELAVMKYYTGGMVKIFGGGVEKPDFSVAGMRYSRDLHPRGFYLKEVAAERRQQQYKPQNRREQEAYDAFANVVEAQMGQHCKEAGEKYARSVDRGGSMDKALCHPKRKCRKWPCAAAGTEEGLGASARTALAREISMQKAENKVKEDEAAVKEAERDAEFARKNLAMLAQAQRRANDEAEERREVDDLLKVAYDAGVAWKQAEEMEVTAAEAAKAQTDYTKDLKAGLRDKEMGMTKAKAAVEQAAQELRMTEEAAKEVQAQFEALRNTNQREQVEAHVAEAAAAVVNAAAKVAKATGELEAEAEKCEEAQVELQAQQAQAKALLEAWRQATALREKAAGKAQEAEKAQDEWHAARVPPLTQEAAAAERQQWIDSGGAAAVRQWPGSSAAMVGAAGKKAVTKPGGVGGAAAAAAAVAGMAMTEGEEGEGMDTGEAAQAAQGWEPRDTTGESDSEGGEQEGKKDNKRKKSGKQTGAPPKEGLQPSMSAAEFMNSQDKQKEARLAHLAKQKYKGQCGAGRGAGDTPFVMDARDVVVETEGHAARLKMVAEDSVERRRVIAERIKSLRPPPQGVGPGGSIGKKPVARSPKKAAAPAEGPRQPTPMQMGMATARRASGAGSSGDPSGALDDALHDN